MSQQSGLALQSHLPIDKKRKVLGDIKNTHYTNTVFAKPMPRKSTSLDSNLIRRDIISSPKKNPTRPSKIPEPSSSSSSNLDKVASETNRRTSQIPRPPHPQVKLDDSVTKPTQLHSKLALLKSSLDKRSHINSLRHGQVADWHHLTQQSPIPTNNTSTKDDTATRINLNKELDTQVKNLQDKIYDLEKESDDLRRLHRKWERKIAEIRADIDILNRKFEFKGESIMKIVANKEMLIDTSLQELSQKLGDEYNETKFQLEEEAKQSAVYEDDLLCKEIEALNQRKDSLTQSLEKAKIEKKQAIKQENDLLLEDLNRSLETKTEEVETVASQYDEKNDELEQLLEKVKTVQNSVRLKVQENDALQESIDTLKYDADHFCELKDELQIKLKNVERELQESTEEEHSWQQQFDKYKGMHEITLSKLKNHNTHRRILENSIMNYENKLRAYIKVPNDITISNECEIQVDDRLFQFNKVFDMNFPETELIQEFELLLKSAINNNNVSIIILGNTADNSRSLITKALRTGYELFQLHIQSHTSGNAWSFSFSLQGIIIEDNVCKDAITGDLLPPTDMHKFQSSLSQVQTQMVPIEDTDNLVRLIQKIESKDQPTAYWININAKHALSSKSFESKLMILDISGESLNRQYDILSEDASIVESLSKFISYSYCHSKCLHISNFLELDYMLKKMLALFEVINATDSPYRSE